jgi:hypothetical protein
MRMRLNHPKHPRSYFLELSRGAARSRFWLGLRLSVLLLFVCFIFGAGRRSSEMDAVYKLGIFYEYKRIGMFPLDDSVFNVLSVCV